MAKITIKDLMEAGVHFGHQTKRWNPKMKDYVYGAKNGIYIIDLTKTMRQIAEASNFLQRKVMDGGDILFVGTKRQAQEVVKEAAEKTKMFFVTERWLGGTLTNNATIQKSVARMQEADKIIANPEATTMKKKEISSLARENGKLHKNLDGISGMRKLPAALVVVDICKEEIAVREARKLKIPVVAIVDTNADIDTVDYPIVANDDAVRSIKIIVDVLGESVGYAMEIYGKFAQERQAAAEAEKAAKEAEEKEKKDAPKRARSARRGGPREGGQGRRGQGTRGAERKQDAAKAAAPAAAPAAQAAAPVAAAAEPAVAKDEAKAAAPAKEAAPAAKPAKADKPKAKKSESKKQDKPAEKAEKKEEKKA